jgi:hypothetical protein
MLLGSSCVVDEVEKKVVNVDGTAFVGIDEDDDDEVEMEVDEDDVDVDGNDTEGFLFALLGSLWARLLRSLECVGADGCREGIGGKAGVADDEVEVELVVALCGCCGPFTSAGARVGRVSRTGPVTCLLLLSSSLLFSMLSSSVSPPSRMVTFRSCVGALFAAGALLSLEPSSSSPDESPNDM